MEGMINQSASYCSNPMKDSVCNFNSEDHCVIVELYQISVLASVILFCGILSVIDRVCGHSAMTEAALK